MATNDPNAKFVNFTFNWKVELSQYEKISVTNWLRKFFFIAFNNVVFQWNAYFRKSKADDSKIGFGICYDDGPLETIKGAQYKVGIVKSDGSVPVIRTTANIFDLNRRQGNAFDNFDDKDSATIRTKYELKETDALVYNITMRLPIETFAYAPTPTPNLLLSRHADRYQMIQDPTSSKFSDAILISRDGTEFYCHKVIVGITEPLETMLSDPLAALEDPKPPTKRRVQKKQTAMNLNVAFRVEASSTSDNSSTEGRGTKRKAMHLDNGGAASSTTGNPSTNGKKNGQYKFKEMATSTLKALIEYLYCGQSTLCGLTITEVIQLADAGEQYLLKPLKELCIAHLWKRVAINPESAFEIARFSDLHDDCKYLKRRAMDVIVENYRNLDVKPKFLPKRFGGTLGEELTGELMDYMAERLRPYFGDW